MKKNLILFSVILFSYSCNLSSKQSEEIEHSHFVLNEEFKKNSEISTVKEELIAEQLTLTGKIEYNQNDLVSFKSLLSGVVEEVKFEQGDFVKKGQLLAVIKSNDILELSQRRQSLENQKKLVEQQLAIKRDLITDGLASIQEINMLESEMQQIKIELGRIKESLSMYKVGNSSGTYYITAPKEGYVIQKEISVGQTISMEGEPLFSISNLNEVWVMLNIYANNLKFIKIGSNVKVRTIAYPDVYYQGKIDKIYNVFDDDEHVLKARVILKNKDLNLLPGLSVDAFIDKKTSNEMSVAIPRKAIIFSNDKQYVVVYKDDHHLEIRNIEQIAENEHCVYIKTGVKAGEKIITKNALLIYGELNK